MNPRAAINDLHPFQGCPFGQLGYFSEYITRYLIRSLKISNSIVFLMSGEDGIRTHVPLRTNGFQDRLVMTNPCALADKRFSRPPRYDHFDTSPCFAPQSVRDLFYHQNSSLSTIFFTFFDIFCFALKCIVIPGAVNKHWRSAGLLVL